MIPSGAPRESPIHGSFSCGLNNPRVITKFRKTSLSFAKEKKCGRSLQLARDRASATLEQEYRTRRASTEGTAVALQNYRAHFGEADNETNKLRICDRSGAHWHGRLRTKRGSKWPGFHDRRPGGKLRHTRHIPDDGQFEQIEPERKRHLHLRRQRCQQRSGQRHDARHCPGRQAG
jgi:hypothetical protein